MKSTNYVAFAVAFFAIHHLGDVASAAPKPSKPKNVAGISFPNYWDANAWDREGGASFWHRTKAEQEKQSSESAQAKNSRNGKTRR